jgi:glycosyltransferase involved in cell wall biosynthesis
VLWRAFVLLRARHPEIALVIAGQHSSTGIARLARELELENDVLLLENLPHAQIAALMKRADFFVLSSRREPFGLVLLEAAAAGKSVVATDTAGTAELMRHLDTGMVVPTEDPAALAEAISHLLENPQEATRMANRFHEHVAEHFTWKQTAARYQELTARLLAGRSVAGTESRSGLLSRNGNAKPE